MKKILIGFSIGFILLTAGLVKYYYDSSKKVSAKVSYFTEDVNKLINDSQVIVYGSVNNTRKVGVGGVKFQVAELQVIKTEKGNLNKGTVINIVQTCDLAQDPLLKKNGKSFLFLKKYDGPISDNAYVIMGLYQGNFKIVNGKIKGVSDLNKTLNDEVKKLYSDQKGNFKLDE